MRKMVGEYNPSCIGETGLDFFRNLSSHDEQTFAFQEQIKIAIDFFSSLESTAFIHLHNFSANISSALIFILFLSLGICRL